MPKCYGTASVGRQGQLVIPADARRDMGLKVHDKVLVFGASKGRMLFLVKAEEFEEMISEISQKFAEIRDAVKNEMQGQAQLKDLPDDGE